MLVLLDLPTALLRSFPTIRRRHHPQQSSHTRTERRECYVNPPTPTPRVCSVKKTPLCSKEFSVPFSRGGSILREITGHVCTQTKTAETATTKQAEFRIKHHHRYRQVALAVTSIFAAKVGCQQGATTAQAGTLAAESRVSVIMPFVRKKCPSLRRSDGAGCTERTPADPSFAMPSQKKLHYSATAGVVVRFMGIESQPSDAMPTSS